MKHFFTTLLIAAMLCSVQLSYAVVAYPGLVNYRQPDGTFVTVRLLGDENFHWAETEDGYTLLADSVGYMTLAMPDAEGNLCASQYRISNIPERSPMLLQAMQAVKPMAQFSETQVQQMQSKSLNVQKARAMAVANSSPVVGTRKYLVILMQFSDVKFQKTKTAFYDLLNKEGYTEGGNSGSVHDYYAKNSYNQLDLDCDVAGIYSTANNMAYYGNNTSGNLVTLANEALTAASKELTLTDYDCDGDGYIDGVHIIFAGYGEEAGGGTDAIWSCEVSSTGTMFTIGGVKVNKFSVTPELSGSSGTTMSKIGVICHEIGHALGTCDWYDTNYSTGGQYPGTGQWDVMGSGNWNNSGATPADFNPYTKIYDFQWTDVIDGNKPQSLTLQAKKKDNFVRIDTNTDGEFFLLECREKSAFDASLPGHGLMVYRASGGLSRKSSNTVNATHQEQFYPLCANATTALPTSTASTYGTLNAASTPFPGTLGKTELTDETTPSMQSWAGEDTGLPITDITENTTDEKVTFNIAGGGGAAYGLKIKDADYNSLTVGWGNDESKTVMLVYNSTNTFGTPESKTYTTGESLSGGGEVIYVGTGTEFEHDGLEDGTYYYYRLYTKSDDDASWSNPLQLKGSTKILAIKNFPYTEDFESKVMPDGWQTEIIQGTTPWQVFTPYTAYTSVLFYGWQSGNTIGTLKARAIMPPFNFANHKNAFLEFDYRNMVVDARLMYRTSSEEDWKLLTVLNNYYDASNLTYSYALNSVEHATIPLPEISDNYEIAIVADGSWRGSSKSNLEAVTIDNIKVTVDQKALVFTGDVDVCSNTWCDVKAQYITGTEQFTSKGVEYSTDQSTWKQVEVTDTGSIHITGLTRNTKYYYRAYGVTASGKIVGTTANFTTDNITTGSGTEDDPFIISTISQWNSFISLLSSGNERKGLCYALSADLTLSSTSSFSTSANFNGILDGKGYTLHVSPLIYSSTSRPIFNQILANGVVKNMTLDFGSNKYSVSGGAGLVSTNNGTISNITLVSDTIYVSNTNFEFYGIARNNYGLVTNSHAELGHIYLMNAKSSSIASFVAYNDATGVISDCTAKGDFYSVGDPAGTSSVNSISGICEDNYYGTVTRCLSSVNLHPLNISGYSRGELPMGGIAETNYGTISQSVYNGQAYLDAHTKFGGISYTTTGNIIDCYSKCVIKENTQSVASTFAGVLYELRSGATISNCFSLNNTYNYQGTAIASKNPVVVSKTGTMTNCYSRTTDTGGYTNTSLTTEGFAAQSLVDNLNASSTDKQWVAGTNGNPTLKWMKDAGISDVPDLNFDPDDAKEITDSIIVASGTCGANGDNVKWALSLTGKLILSGSGKMAEYTETTIPWYSYISSVKNVTLTNGITNIGSYAFFRCRSLASISIPSTVNRIGIGAFLYCNALKQVIIPEGVDTIPEGAFHDCTGLDSIYIPNTVKYIGWKAFRYTPALKSVTFPESLKEISYGCFEFQVGLTKITCLAKTPPTITTTTFSAASKSIPVYVPESSLAAYKAATGWSLFTNFKTFPDDMDPNLIAKGTCGANAEWTLDKNYKITISGTGAMTDYSESSSPWFSYNSKIKEVEIKDGITSVGDYAFYNCSSLSSLSLPQSLTSIGNSAFMQCYALGTLDLPESLESMGTSAFRNCTSITELYLPAKLKLADGGAICGMTGLQKLAVDANNPYYVVDDNVLYSHDKSALLLYLPSRKGEYQLPEEVKTIGQQAFSQSQYLSEITVPSTVTKIERAAFDYSQSLESVTIEASLDTVSQSMFLSCKSLKSVRFLAPVKVFDTMVFNNCTALRELSVKSATPPALNSFLITSECNVDSISLFVPINSIQQYKSHTYWSQFTRIYALEEAGEPIEHPDYSTVDNVLYIADASANVGKQVTLPVMMNNTGDVTAFEFDLYVPKGITVATDANGKYLVKRVTDRMTYNVDDGYSHTIQSSLKNDNGEYVKVLCTSTTNQKFTGNSGAVANITFNIAEGVKTGYYAIRLRNEKLTHLNTQNETYDEAIANINVKEYTLGDVNDDGSINTGDYVGVVNLILGTNTEGLIRNAADVNNDDNVDAGDCVGIINYVLYDYFVPQSSMSYSKVLTTIGKPSLALPAFIIAAGETKTVSMALNNISGDCSALQFDMSLPAGLTLSSVRWDKGRTCLENHSLKTSLQPDGKIRVLGSSSTNESFNGTSGNIISLTFEADDRFSDSAISVDNIKLAKTDASVMSLDDIHANVSWGGTTAINSICTPSEGDTIYTLDGARVKSIGSRKGVYVVNGKKIIK